MDNETLGLIILLLSIPGSLWRLWGLHTGRFKPHFFSWFIWALITFISFGAQWHEGAGPGSWYNLSAAVLCLYIAVFSLRYRQTMIKRIDWVCFILSLLAIVGWVLTHNPLVAVMIVCVADVLAFLPTFRHNWRNPWDDQLFGYTTGAINYGLSLLAMDVVNATTTLHPIVIIITNMSFVAMALWRRRLMPRQTTA
ncbi:MAG: hypothetical protein EBQ89_09700 [Alphaproteobacteria bacterium]|nr:hypothetical protein [Alphaproteobacteria bacterium]